MIHTEKKVSRYYWLFVILFGLIGYMSQTSRSSDLMGSVDGAGIILLLLSVFLLFSLLGRVMAALVCALLVVSSLLLLAGNYFYLALYQSYIPFSLLTLAPESGALIKSFPLWQVLCSIALMMGVAWLIYKLVLSLTFPRPGALVLAIAGVLASGILLQLWHDSRSFKHFSSYSESPAGYFLRSAGIIPFVVGSAYDERWANINGYARGIVDGGIEELPNSYAKAVRVFYPEHSSQKSLYPLYNDNLAERGKEDAPAVSQTVDRRKNVIVLVLESFRASESGVYGHSESATPFMDELALQSIRANRFYSTSPLTTKSETAINCGVLDYFGGAALSSREESFRFSCVPEILKNQGYDTYWFHGNTKSYYKRAKYLSRMGFDRTYGIEDIYNKSFDLGPNNNAGRGTAEHPILGWGIPDTVLFERALEKLGQSDKPFYAEIMSLSNHMPFSFNWGIKFPDYLQKQETMYERYRRGLYYTDYALKGFIEKFRRSSLYDNTIVIVTGDHGVWTFDKGDFLSDFNKHEQFFRVPLLIFSKEINPGVIKTPASHVDIPPTVLSMLDIHVPTAFMGRSLIEEPDKIVPVFNVLEASYGVHLGNQVCMPENPCFRDGDEQCDAHQREWSKKSNMTCYEDKVGSLVGGVSTSMAIPQETLDHFDNLLNYMMLSLKIGIRPES